jgi:tetratricopeptide (TPR) repeat protein
MMRRVLVAALLLALAAPAPARAAETVAVRAAEHDKEGFGRIAFDWPAPVAFEAKLDGRVLTIHFARPLEAKLGVVISHLDSYIATVRIGAEGDSVIAELKRPATLRTFSEGNVIAIDMITDAKLAKALPAKAAAAKPAQPVTSSAAPAPAPAATVGIRVAEHQGFRRVIFDWSAPVHYALSEQLGTARLRFDRATTLDAAPLAAELPDLQPALQAETGATVLTFTVPAGVRLRHFRSGNSVVLDVLGQFPPAAKAPAPQDIVPPPELIEPSAGGPPEPGPPPLGAPLPVTRPSGAAQPPPGSLPVHYVLAPDGASLRFDWPNPTAAAVFRRGPALWIVFPRAKLLDLTELRRLGGDFVLHADQLPDAKATVLRLVTRPGIGPSVRRTEDGWIVDLKALEARADTPITLEARPAAESPEVRFAVREPSEPVYFRDPEVGDLLAVVPVGEMGRGIGTSQDFVDFTALATVQGIALRPNADDLRVFLAEGGVAVTRPGGLLLSPASELSVSQEPEKIPGRLFDFARWRGPASQGFLQKRSRLEQAVAATPVAYRTKTRLALAQFYFANLYAPEAEGVLEAIRHDDPTLSGDPAGLLMMGAVHLMLGDQKRAAQELGQELLGKEPEAQLWRASLSAELGDWEVAARGFAQGTDLLGRYPMALRDRFALQAAEALLETSQADQAQPMIQLVLKGGAPPHDRAMALYLDGRRLLALGDHDQAIARWNQVAAMDDRLSRARALFARTLAELDAKAISRTEAVKMLDQLRFAWRGDLVEFNLLRKLGELKLADGDQRGGFDVLREVAANFPDYPQSKEVVKELSDSVTELFLTKGLDDVPPLKALTLYDDFKEYVPAGERSDAVVRRLVDRLVSVDLLDRAAALLEDQVAHHLTGHDKARVAAQLALIRLLDHHPGEAIKALDIDVGTDVPPDLLRQRQQLRARALSELNRSDEALALLASDTSRDADRLRADIFWRARNWAEAAKVFSRLVPVAGTQALDKGASQLVLNWASALTLAGDQQGLGELRAGYGKAMAASPFAEAFRVVAGNPSSGAGETDPRTIANRVAQVSDLQSFMTNFKARLAKEKLSAIN